MYHIVPITKMQPLEPLFETARAAGAAPAGGSPFAEILKSAVTELQQAQAQSDQDAYDLAMGRTDDLPGIMINSLRLSTAVEVTTQLTTRAVGTYKEIMQMQV